MDHSQKKIRAARVSIVTAVFLAVMKFAVGIFSGSMAVLSSAIDSMLDIVMSGVNYLAISHAEQPADANHPYGHGKFETLATVIQSVVIGGSGVWIIIESVQRLMSGHAPGRLTGGIIALLISVGVSFVLSRYLKQVARQTDSSALAADSLHFSMDIYTNLALLVGLVVMSFFHLAWIDNLLSIVVACYIIFEAGKLVRLALRDVLDEQLPEDLRRQIIEIIVKNRSNVFSFHNLRTRRAGSQKLIDFHMTVCKHLSVDEAHRLTEDIEQDIRQLVAGADIMIHVEPCEQAGCNGPEDCTQLVDKERETK
ncbi:cation diffusion facilitator family transporter [Desulfogranum japonicum]|uniref:cation diffusion facilitator family transporter n=1 Tax=Desulfogranum japonicum TaxID=231447 RepID=UPI0005574653|nr:cation diffusion facilitator family transporter [Desulfogranum japonicum]